MRPVPTLPPLMAPRLRRMCGGGSWERVIATRWEQRTLRRLPRSPALRPDTVRRHTGAVIFDGPGVALVWRENWR